MNIINLHPDAWKGLCARKAQLPHALLLCGQRGIGKFKLASLFAESLLCENPKEPGLACGECSACNWMKQGNHPDFRLLQPEILMQEEVGAGADADSKKKPSQQITIDQVRALEDFLHVGTHRDGVRVILVYPAEAMNRSTANSLLKSLEEPIANTLFILVSNEPSRLLPTIRSRCQMMGIPVPSTELSSAWLKDQGIEQIDQFLALAGGAPLQVLELGQNEERNLLNALQNEWKQGGGLDFISAAANIDKLVKGDKRSAPLKRVVEWMQKWVVDLTLVCNAMDPRYFLLQADVLKQLPKKSIIFDLLAFERKAIQYKLYCEQPLNSRLFLEELFLNYKKLFRN